jgi:hypothetical protein
LRVHLLDCLPNTHSCFTNHALDQFLEHLLTVTKCIVRIGTRSKSESLQAYNLHDLARQQQGVLKSGSQRFEEGRLYRKLEELETDGTELCGSLRDQLKMKWSHVSAFLEKYFPHQYAQLCNNIDEDGFQTVGAKGGNFFSYWMQCQDIRKGNEFSRLYGTPYIAPPAGAGRNLQQLVSPNANIWNFSANERRRLLGHWAARIREEWIEKLNIRTEDHIEGLHELDILHSECDRRVLEGADIIGLTTTGLARYASLLHRINSKTLICEEAGEVLEVCDHLIMG